ncbi:hypothetical protein BpHYR1_035118 [Brachionus plicatilis]|uniref:Uncharacterized protein n=1 Tax=Brachionus plicatilis TaxID=10195 RepID=A0A3M7RJ48_BRAPC|nr:hypothetical protein BpHYR1_035118 [Brachionus plicatilis]
MDMAVFKLLLSFFQLNKNLVHNFVKIFQHPGETPWHKNTHTLHDIFSQTLDWISLRRKELASEREQSPA